MANTPNYNLKKVEYTEIADIPGHFNGNFDKIDEELKERDTRVGPLASLLTTIKTSIVNAINSLKGEVDAHKADKVTDDDGIHGLKMKKGTWTPEIDAETTSPTVNYTAQQGYYVRNGDIVHVSFYISCTISGGSGRTFITGLPISPDNHREVGNMGIVQHNNIAVNYYSLQNGAKLNQFRILKDSRFPLQISEINDSNNFTMTGSITYRI